MSFNICLIGNPNCGKTSLFNCLTGANQKVGNWTGVTVESKIGVYKKNKNVSIIDLPGIYSLNPFSLDEEVVLNFIKKNKPNAIINVIDGLNLERSLFLTAKLSSLNIPCVIAINMIDRLQSNNILVNEKEISKLFGVDVVKISAKNNFNIDNLIDIAISSKKKLYSFNNLPDKDIYAVIEKNINKLIEKKQSKIENLTLKIDNILTHKFFGFPITFLVFFLVYFLSMKIGGFFSNYISLFFKAGSDNLCNYLLSINCEKWFISLFCYTIINGIGVIFSFLPQILILFLLLTVVEQSGYSSRVAFLFDGLLNKFGLGGKSIIPIMLSSGCSVSGIMATRTIENVNERRLTLFMVCCVPCGAKMAVFAWFSQMFFNGSPLVATSLYFIGLFFGVIFGNILNKFKFFKSNSGTFILEMPYLSFPSLKDVLSVMFEKTKEFTIKAGTIIFSVSIILWLLKNFGISGYVGEQTSKSFLFYFGNILKYMFIPLGFGNWQVTISLLSGVFAKEAIIETLHVIDFNYLNLFDNIYSVYAFLVFVLLSPPCIATLSSIKRELNNKKIFSFLIIFQFVSAYFVALLINLYGILNKGVKNLPLYLIVVIILTLIAVTSFKLLFNNKCNCCNKKCKRGSYATKKQNPV